MAKQPLVANKQFYYMAELEAETILKKNLPDIMMQYYLAGKNMNAFLKRAMHRWVIAMRMGRKSASLQLSLDGISGDRAVIFSPTDWRIPLFIIRGFPQSVGN